jgi:hypothetical protein
VNVQSGFERGVAEQRRRLNEERRNDGSSGSGSAEGAEADMVDCADGIIPARNLRSENQGDNVELQPLIVIIVGILFLGLIWRVIKGVIRFAFMIGLLLALGYVVLNMLR